jgi:hypothetical protein
VAHIVLLVLVDLEAPWCSITVNFFAIFEISEAHWDTKLTGHTTLVKYQRLRTMSRRVIGSQSGRSPTFFSVRLARTTINNTREGLNSLSQAHVVREDATVLLATLPLCHPSPANYLVGQETNALTKAFNGGFWHVYVIMSTLPVFLPIKALLQQVLKVFLCFGGSFSGLIWKS